MTKIDDFFSIKNKVSYLTKKEQKQTGNYLKAIEAFARTTYKSIYVIDYEKKGFEFVSENPLFLCGHSAEEVKNMGYLFYFKYVIPEDLELLVKINTAGFNFYENIPLEERLLHSISYDYQLKNQEGKRFLINQKLTPLFLTNDGKIWKAICIISLSNEQTSGNIKIVKSGQNKEYVYDLDGDYWRVQDKITLSLREKEILTYSVRGFTIKDMATEMFVSPDTVKFHRKKLFEKLEVTNISEAIVYSTNNKLI